VDQLMKLAIRHNADGWNLDLEPQNSVSSDALVYADFCRRMKLWTDIYKLRLSVDVALWSPMIAQFELLSINVDRIYDMDTYVANSYSGWLLGDDWGGNYSSFVNDKINRSKNGIGLGAWPTEECGKVTCWSAMPQSGLIRINRIIQDNILDIGIWDIEGPQSNTDNTFCNSTPMIWWWPLFELFAQS